MKMVKVLLTFFAAFCSVLSAAKKPNIVLIVADDLGYGDVSYHETLEETTTVHIDSIAKNGAWFQNGYSAAPVCGPSRAGLMSGRYQQRFGYYDNIGPFKLSKDSEEGLPLKQKIIPEILVKQGYATGMVGKWHDGDDMKYWPHNRGFQEFYGFNNGAANNWVLQKENLTTNEWGAIHRNDKRVANNGEYLTNAFGREAVEFIERHKAKPFFLYVAFNAVHGPLQAPAALTKQFAGVQPRLRGITLAMLKCMDNNIGKILTKLRQESLEDDTIVIFTSDNGGKLKGNFSYNGKYRGEKNTVFDGGLHVPYAIQWKGHFAAHTKPLQAPVHSIDIAQTVFAAAGIEVKDEWKLDGLNLLPYLKKQSDLKARNLYWANNANIAIRDGKWKLVKQGGKVFLFDLSKDPYESKNVLGQFPEEAQNMQKKHDHWQSQNAPQLFGWNPNNCKYHAGYRGKHGPNDKKTPKKKRKTKR